MDHNQLQQRHENGTYGFSVLLRDFVYGRHKKVFLINTRLLVQTLTHDENLY